MILKFEENLFLICCQWVIKPFFNVKLQTKFINFIKLTFCILLLVVLYPIVGTCRWNWAIDKIFLQINFYFSIVASYLTKYQTAFPFSLGKCWEILEWRMLLIKFYFMIFFINLDKDKLRSCPVEPFTKQMSWFCQERIPCFLLLTFFFCYFKVVNLS